MGKEIEIKVEDLDGDKLPFKGSVKIKVKPYKERLAIAQEISGLQGKDDKALMEKMVGLAFDNVVSVSLQHKSKKFTDLEEVSYFKEGAELINRIAATVAAGPSLGN